MQRAEVFSPRFSSSKATSGVVLIDTSPKPDLDMVTIRRKRPGDVRKKEIRPRSLHRTPCLKEMLNWTLFKSSRANLQDNRNVIRILRNNGLGVKSWGHSTRPKSKIYCSTAGKNKRNVGLEQSSSSGEHNLRQAYVLDNRKNFHTNKYFRVRPYGGRSCSIFSHPDGVLCIPWRNDLLWIHCRTLSRW